MRQLPFVHSTIARSLASFALVGLIVVSGVSAATASRRVTDDVSVNPNIERAGLLRDGVLTVDLEAKASTWHPNGPAKPGLPIEAFSEAGKAPLSPGPLVRVPQGTEIRFSVRNTFARSITFMLPAAMHGGANTVDSVVVAPGAVETLATRAITPGNYVYRALSQLTPRNQYVSGLLTGGIVIDSAGSDTRPKDRVFVMTEAFAPDGAPVTNASGVAAVVGRVVFMVNGLSWPRTERIAATTGDSLHWRIINASAEIHPMHLHGFYFRVESFSPPSPNREIRGAPGRMEVTERMPQLSGMSIVWSPDRPGNWIFHCHFPRHIAADPAAADAAGDAHGDHAMTGMGGLVLGVNVAQRRGQRVPKPVTPKRRLRLVAIADKGFPDSLPSMRFVIEERGRRAEAGPYFSPTMDLVRGEAVSIMVVNQLREATAVHWHGIELESYNDGVPGMSGSGKRLAPMIAPRDSFEVAFTPPRSGTFMYHSHVNEVRQQQAGLLGAIVVRDLGAKALPDEQVFFLKGTGEPTAVAPLEINGRANPDTVVLHAGQPARLRFISLAAINANATAMITARRDSSFAYVADSLIQTWRPLAKDGADLPAAEQAVRAARQIIGMGETHDFEFTPTQRGTLRLEVRTYGPTGTLLARVPIRVE